MSLETNLFVYLINSNIDLRITDLHFLVVLKIVLKIPILRYI